MKHDSHLMTVAEVAGWLRLSRSTVYDMVQGHRIPFYRVANRIRFCRSELEEHLMDSKVVLPETQAYGSKKDRKELVD